MVRNNKRKIAAGLVAGLMLLSGIAHGAPGDSAAAHTQVAKEKAKKQTPAVNNQAPRADRMILSSAAQAAELYAFGLQQRNASIQYAVFSKEFKKVMYPRFEKLNWVTGGSSPWITKWEITKRTTVSSKAEKLEVRLDTATSTGADASIILTISLVMEKDSWVINSVTSNRELPRSGIPVVSNGVPAFSENDAVKLAAAASARYWYIVSGGATNSEGPIKEFSIPGKGDHYRWLGDDLNTQKKLFTYLEVVYTAERVQQFWNIQVQNGSLVDVNGRLAQPNADGGSLLSWSKAKAVLISDTAALKIFRFDIPAGDNGHTVADVTFRYVEGKGWRLDTDVNRIK